MPIWWTSGAAIPKAGSFDRFAFFVLFFPQLIAGPIVLFRNINRQMSRPRHDNSSYRSALQLGLILFAIGLFKKVVIADSMTPFADAVFGHAERTDFTIGVADAWVGAVAYSLQLYFDFSGYSDMAIGLGRMFGFRLPTNFNSPYQADSIIDFWRRWHITLSSFFRDYVYIPLGGNRKGVVMQAAFILTVFLLTGLWHGAGWTFIVWGALHGVLVLANHLWLKAALPAPRLVSWPLTLLAVVSLWVVFRATTLASAGEIVATMWGAGGVIGGAALSEVGLYPLPCLIPALVGVLALTMPNSAVLAHRLRHGRLTAGGTSRRQPARWWLPATVTGAALYLAITSIGNVASKFIYFNF